jgi:hypothetical protein
MLGKSTLELLADFQEKSHEAYSEGGLLYTYVEAANQAHFKLPEDSAAFASLGQQDLDTLGRFLQASQGEYLAEAASEAFTSAAENLLKLLLSDLGFDEVLLVFQDGGHDMGATLKMARRSDNRFFELDLWWSID